MNKIVNKNPDANWGLKEPMVALIVDGFKINLMSMDFYQKGKWLISTKHEWEIKEVTRVTK